MNDALTKPLVDLINKGFLFVLKEDVSQGHQVISDIPLRWLVLPDLRILTRLDLLTSNLATS
ncbi:hypothetical protein [Aquibacillus albus]|uniref:hypothetical protein n=1 Tax=Aquibacillus albus TaxID=1168171 RepID=UPI00195EE439|nr:hypothetical protein [Aquibacillus albus]